MSYSHFDKDRENVPDRKANTSSLCDPTQASGAKDNGADGAEKKIITIPAGYSRLYNVSDGQAAVEDTGVEMGEIIGWRFWRVTREEGITRLTSPYLRSCVWTPGLIMIGDPYARPFICPKGANMQGVHAFASEGSAHRRLKGATAGQSKPTVMGQVELWGEVIEHYDGYRASHAFIHSLDYIAWHHPPGNLLSTLQEIYNVKGGSNEQQSTPRGN